MTAATLPTLPTRPEPPAVTPAATRTMADWLISLGGISPRRILIDLSPGTATIDDVIRLSHREGCGVELVNRTLVEKPVGLRESVVAGIVLTLLNNIVRAGRLGFVSGEQGMIRMLMGNVRMPDMAFFRREDLPDGGFLAEAAPRLTPALAVEVLSPGNTDAELAIKLREYFENGVRFV